MKKVLLLGATGMLGSAVYNVLKDKYYLILAVRDVGKIALLNVAYGAANYHRTVTFDAARLYQDFYGRNGNPSAYWQSFLREVGEVDYVINAVGVTIPFSLKNEALTFFINGALPHVLADTFGEKLIHITTDCAFNGKDGYPYDERSSKTSNDVYGLAKSMGEPEHCLTIRTSIIGRELHGFNGLLEWFLQQAGGTVSGFAGHYWNGVTTTQFGRICDQIMSEPDKYPRKGLYHVFSDTVSKYDMLLAFRDRYGIDCEIKKDTEQKLNRSLATVKELNNLLKTPSFKDMLRDLDDPRHESKKKLAVIEGAKNMHEQITSRNTISWKQNTSK